MSANPMSTEMQCLAKRLHESTQELVNDLNLLALFIEVGAPKAKKAESLEPVAVDLCTRARAMQFDAARLALLADDQAEDGRYLYTITTELLGCCHRARMTLTRPDGAVFKPDPGTIDLADLVEGGMADMRMNIAAQFPGETISGG